MKVIIVSGVGDRIYPAKPIAERLGKNSVDGFIAVQGAHGPQYSAHVAQLLFDAAKKREKKAAN